MNSKLLMLGILLLAGLSFAQNWMEYSTQRYICNYFYNYGGYEGPVGLTSVANNDFAPEDDCFDYEAMNEYRVAMSVAILGEEGYLGMCTNSGCWEGEISTSGFRNNMLSYNTNAVQFKALFLEGVRYCMSEYPATYPRATVLGWLNTAKADYSNCLSDSAGESCSLCDSYLP